MPTQIIGSGEEIWAEGYVFQTIAGDADGLVPLAEMQDFSLRDDITLVEAFGASHTGAVAVAQKSSAITGTAKWLRVRARQFLAARGGSVSTASSVTTYARAAALAPKVFENRFLAPSVSDPDCELITYNCIAPSLNLPLAQRDFAMPDTGWNCYGKTHAGHADAHIFYEIILPGDQTES